MSDRSAGMAVNFLFPLPHPLFKPLILPRDDRRSSPQSPDRHRDRGTVGFAGLANLREFEKDETVGIILDNALTEDNGYLSEHNHSGKATMIITPFHVY